MTEQKTAQGTGRSQPIGPIPGCRAQCTGGGNGDKELIDAHSRERRQLMLYSSLG